MNFDLKSISSNRSAPVYLIAEVGVNHNGNLGLAKSMVRSAAECGAHAVKFQTFTAEGLVTRGTPKVEYQKSTTSDQESHYEMIKNLEMPESFYPELIELCNELKVDFLSTPYDVQSVDFLESLNVGLYKAASADLVDHILLERIAKTLKPTILSTGMATLGEIEEALEIFHKQGNEQVILLHCVSNYPCSISSLNLLSMQTLSHAFGFPVGYSDHSEGSLAASISVALGAVLVEKHFTTDKTLAGPDQAASSSPEEFRELVSQVRLAQSALGSPVKACQEEERQMSFVSRKSLVTSRELSADSIIQREDLTVKRPGTGLRSKVMSEVIGRRVRRDLPVNHLLDWGDFQ